MRHAIATRMAERSAVTMVTPDHVHTGDLSGVRRQLASVRRRDVTCVLT